jgi:hypothetical protein
MYILQVYKLAYFSLANLSFVAGVCPNYRLRRTKKKTYFLHFAVWQGRQTVGGKQDVFYNM